MFVKKIIALTSMALAISIPPSQAQEFDSVSHIHSVEAFGKKVLMGTHEGFFLFTAQNSMKAVGKERFDVMGLTSSGKVIFASGHPGKDSQLPNPVGLLRSDDQGVTWKKVSLQGKVDFHFMEAGESEIYGVDAQTGMLMYSSNVGKSWRVIGQNKFSDIAISNTIVGKAYALRDKQLVKSKDAFASLQLIRTNFPVDSLELHLKALYVASGKSIFRSINEGKSWVKVQSFDGLVADLTSSNEILVAVVDGKILFSSDKGKTFRS